MRQWRVLRMLEASRRGLTVSGIHQALGGACDRRTVYRDLEQLSDAGFPLIETKGRWRMLEASEGGWNVPVHPTELLALALGEELVATTPAGWLSEPIDSLRDKLLSILSPQGRRYYDALRASTVATAFGSADMGNHTAILAPIYRAIRETRVLRMEHRPLGRPPLVRDVEPYSLWFHGGVCYLVARCLLREDFRTFAVERITRIEATEIAFEPLPTFDPAAYVREAFGPFHGPAMDVTIDFAPALEPLVRQRRYHPTQEVLDGPKGWARLTLHAGGLQQIAAWVASFGGRARPVAPRELVEAVRRLHLEGLEQIRQEDIAT